MLVMHENICWQVPLVNPLATIHNNYIYYYIRNLHVFTHHRDARASLAPNLALRPLTMRRKIQKESLQPYRARSL